MSAIDDVTLVTIETHYHALAGRAIQECVDRIPFRNVITFSDRPIIGGATNIPVNTIGSMRDYCDILLKGMWPFVRTGHVIFAQWDAMIFDETKWTDDYLEYDYIGAIWPWQPPGQNVGNGGFSLRSAKLLNALRDPFIHMTPEGPHGVQEDNYIAIVHRQMLEKKYGIRFAPPEVAAQFSYELGDYKGSMAFHGFWNVMQFMPKPTVDFFFANRPPNMFNELHRAHHIIVALGNTDRVDLVASAVEEIKSGRDFAQLFQWLSQDTFDNKAAIINLLV